MTRLARAGKCVWCETLEPASKLGFSNEPSAAVPIPAVSRPKKWRRVNSNALSRKRSISTFGQKLVQVHDHARDRRPRSHFSAVRAAGAAQLFGRRVIVLKIGKLLLISVLQDFHLVRFRRSGQSHAEGKRNALTRLLLQNAPGQSTRRLDKMRIV